MTQHPASTRAALAAAFLFVLVAVLVQLGLTQPLDEAILRAVLVGRTSFLTSIMVVFSTLAGGVVLACFVLGFSAWLRVSRGGATALFYIGTCLTGWGMYALLKMAFGRPRPSLIPRLSGAGWASFPSGHAMIATVFFGLAMVLITERSKTAGSSRAVIAAGSLVIAGVVVSRVYLGVHYPSDVVAGILAGWAWTAGALASIRPRMAPRP